MENFSDYMSDILIFGINIKLYIVDNAFFPKSLLINILDLVFRDNRSLSKRFFGDEKRAILLECLDLLLFFVYIRKRFMEELRFCINSKSVGEGHTTI